ncbi:MAG TPA: riboflavin kinase [Patescibacteria group bacterium]|nr:riboflavin kinase [Patescibacteria group bacterium]
MMPEFFKGRVVHGNKEGRLLGYPTANLPELEPLPLLPGIYGGLGKVDGVEYIAAVVVKPGASHIEAHLLELYQNIYGKELELTVDEFIRPWQEFSDLEALKAQIQKDVNIIKLKKGGIIL